MEKLKDYVVDAAMQIKEAVQEMRTRGIDCDAPDFLDMEVQLGARGGLNSIVRESKVMDAAVETIVTHEEEVSQTQRAEYRLNMGGGDSETNFTYTADT